MQAFVGDQHRWKKHAAAVIPFASIVPPGSPSELPCLSRLAALLGLSTVQGQWLKGWRKVLGLRRVREVWWEGGLVGGQWTCVSCQEPSLSCRIPQNMGAAGYSMGAAGYSMGAAGYSMGAAGYSMGAAGYSMGAAGYNARDGIMLPWYPHNTTLVGAGHAYVLIAIDCNFPVGSHMTKWC
ncbi:unnamed protein product [Closterium sp. Naga37s-1]|nr:unnamed protein product [Closterium sp. Naga37s-1]